MKSWGKNLLFIILLSLLGQTLANAQQVSQSGWDRGRVSFTFDDGYKSVYENGLPIFKKYGLVGTFSVVVEWIDYQVSRCVTWEQVAEFQNAGWEIGCHTMTHPYLDALSDDELEYELGQSRQVLADHNINAKTLVFPFGAFNSRVLDYTTRYYYNSREAGGTPGLNGLDLNGYMIKGREVTDTTTPEEVCSWIGEAMQKREWLVLYFHEIVTGTPTQYQYNAADLEKIVSYVKQRGIPAPTIDQAMQARVKILGTNLIENPDFNALDPQGWALHWTRNDSTQVKMEPVFIPRIFSSVQHLKIVAGSDEYSATTQEIILPYHNRTYLLSMFVEVTAADAGGTEIYMDEYDSSGNWLGGQWLGGFYENTFAMPSFFYQPTSNRVYSVMINVYTIAGSALNFAGDTFYFGAVSAQTTDLSPLLLLLLQN